MMSPGTLIFDCDSTLLSIETTDRLCQLAYPGQEQQAEALTALGMEGKLSFEASIRGRMERFPPTQTAIAQLLQELPNALSKNVPLVLQNLRQKGWLLFLVSGGLDVIIHPLARLLDIPLSHTACLETRWLSDGTFEGLNPNDPMLRRKSHALKALQSPLKPPVYIIGDGMTDAQLKEDGVADFFVYDAEHVWRSDVQSRADWTIHSFADLLERLTSIEPNPSHSAS
jgi:phosphoserine phosphatase